MSTLITAPKPYRQPFLIMHGKNEKFLITLPPNIEARQARLGKMRPVLKARAGSSEKSDIRATKVSTHLLTSIQHDQKVRDKVHEVIKWIEATGTCFF